MKFGRLPSAPEKLARRLWLRDYLTLPVIPPAKSYDITAPWGMLGNDTVGDCTCAAAGHADMIAEIFGEKVTPAVTSDEVLSAYSAITGYNPDDPNSDQGANMLDVLKYWQKTGIAGQKCSAYVAFDPTNKAHWEAATYLFGFVYIGVNLPDIVTKALPTIIDWTDTTDAPDQNNGHCIIGCAYADSEGVTIVTWGQTVRATWAFLAKYCDEAYAVLLPAWAQGDPPGIDMTQLTADLAVVQGGGIIPAPTPPNPTPPAPPPGPAPVPSNIVPTVIRILKAVETAIGKAVKDLEELLG